jgi:hypothetical protein
MIVTSPALSTLERSGYDTHAISSGFASADIDSVDHLVRLGMPSDMEIALIRSTTLGPLIEGIAPDALASAQRARIRGSFDAITALEFATDQPRFVFAHVPAPHGPWVFRADGQPQPANLRAFYTDSPTPVGVSREEAIRQSFEQATYVGKLVVETIDILDRRAGDPVIVVMSDHGPGVDLDLSDPLKGVAERSSNLLAVRTPGREEVVPDGTTPVNLFVLLLNEYLGTSYPKQPDTTFAWRPGSSQTDTLGVPSTALD